MASFWGRVVSAVNAAIYTFNERALVPEDHQKWDDYRARLFRYALSEAYYNNSVYREIESFATLLKHRYGLYRHIRGVYNPVYRQVEILSSKIAGGALDWEGLQNGPVQVVGADDTLIEAIIQVLRWSNWGRNKSVYVRQAAQLGDIALKIIDDQQRERVRMEVLHPGKIKDVTLDELGNIKTIAIEYNRVWTPPDGSKPVTVVYTEEIDQDTFRTYKDGEPFAWYANSAGEGMAEWPNEYGFVPVALAPFKDVGQTWGANSFHASLTKINEINDAASVLNDSARRMLNPVWYAPNSQPGSIKPDVKLSDGTSTSDPSAQRDRIVTLHGPADSQPVPLVMQMDVASTAQNVQNMLMELERDMPELAMHRVREMGGGLSGVAIRNMFSDASGRIEEAASNLDDGMMRAIKMAISMGAIRGYGPLRTFNANSFERGDLEFYIKDRELFGDDLSKAERIAVIQSLPDNPAAARFILEKELEVPDDVVAEIVANIQPQQQEGQGMTPRFFDDVGMQWDEIDNGAGDVAPIDEQEVVDGAAA